MAENGPFGTPFLTPQIPPKKFMWVPFLRTFLGNNAQKLFSWGPKWGGLGGGQKVYVEKVYVFFRSRSAKGLCAFLLPVLGKDKQPKEEVLGRTCLRTSGHKPWSGPRKGRKKHINFFNINFLAPTRNPQFWAPQKKVYVPHFLGKNAKKGPT